MRRLGLMFSFAAALAAAPMVASAQPSAYALDGAEVFAGPGQDYPLVARLGPGVAVRVQGCLSDYSWCDVTFGASRGWVYGGELGYAYQSRRVPIVDYGPRLALPIISFSLGNYWDRYYRGRTFYRERNDWERRWRDHRGGHEWRGNDRRGDWNHWNRDNGRRDNDRQNYYRDRGNGRNDNNRGDYRGNNRGNNRTDGNVRGDGHGGYTPNINANRADPPGSAPNFDNGAGHQQ